VVRRPLCQSQRASKPPDACASRAGVASPGRLGRIDAARKTDGCERNASNADATSKLRPAVQEAYVWTAEKAADGVVAVAYNRLTSTERTQLIPERSTDNQSCLDLQDNGLDAWKVTRGWWQGLVFGVRTPGSGPVSAGVRPSC